MNLSIIGGGSFGTVLAQVLTDNKHNVLIREINPDFVNKINNDHIHPFFNEPISSEIKATLNLEETLNFADIVVLCVPTAVMRSVLKEIGQVIKEPKIFINVSKGIEPSTSKLVSDIVYEEIPNQFVKGFCVLAGPSFAIEILRRKATTLVAASNDGDIARLIQTTFANPNYLRVYTSHDVIGVEVCGAVKNAIAFVSGMAEGLDLGMNARAALLTRGNREIIKIVKALGGLESTCYGLTGIGDLFLTASSIESRNFQAGKRVGQGEPLDHVLSSTKTVVEGIRAIDASYHIGQTFNLDLPIINLAHKIIFDNFNVNSGVSQLLSRKLIEE